jgi:hypothetical protein
MSPRAARILGLAGAVILVAGLTALVFLVRAGAPDTTNWPIDWELRSSDNGVLFQFAQDVFAGRSLDWSFSPQVFVFPEIPISVLSFLIAGGSVQGYYLVVAAVNNALLFLAVFAVVRYLYPTDRSGRQLARAGIAMLPLLLLPLIGSTPLLSYALAPTYYFGMYLALFAAPAMLLARSTWVRVLLAVGVALVGASNPLTFVFLLPAALCAFVVQGIRVGFRQQARPLALTALVVILALAIRLLLFGRLQGGSPLSYVDPSIFSSRIATVQAYLQGLLSGSASGVVLVAGITVACAGVIVAVVLLLRAVRGRAGSDPRIPIAVYYCVVPLGGLAAMSALIITDYLYLWPVIVAPLVFVLLALPGRWASWALPVAGVVLVGAFVFSGGVTAIRDTPSYFTYRSAETQCLDSKLPTDVSVGYSTFSDARRLSLTSARPFRLIQLKSSGVRAYWLTNRDYARDSVGRFFYLNDGGDEPAISTSYIESRFGMPDRQFSCGAGQRVLIYDRPAKLAKIAARYSELPAPGS